MEARRGREARREVRREHQEGKAPPKHRTIGELCAAAVPGAEEDEGDELEGRGRGL